MYFYYCVLLFPFENPLSSYSSHLFLTPMTTIRHKATWRRNYLASHYMETQPTVAERQRPRACSHLSGLGTRKGKCQHSFKQPMEWWQLLPGGSTLQLLLSRVILTDTQRCASLTLHLSSWRWRFTINMATPEPLNEKEVWSQTQKVTKRGVS